MATNVNCVFLSPQGTQIKHESNLTTGTAYPGMILELTATGVASNTTADAAAPLFAVADLAVSTAGAIGTEYNTTDNDRVNWKVPQSGELINLYVAASTVIAVNAQLGTAAGGGVKTVAAADVGVIAYALEALTTTTESGFVKAIVK